MSAMSNAVRALVILTERLATKAELARDLGVSERTVKRYLRAFEDAGVRVDVYDSQGGSVPGQTYNQRRMYRVIL